MVADDSRLWNRNNALARIAAGAVFRGDVVDFSPSDVWKAVAYWRLNNELNSKPFSNALATRVSQQPTNIRT